MSTDAVALENVKVSRSTKSSWAGLVVGIIVVLILATAPYVVGRGLQQNLVILFSLIVLGTMWNLLAGYGGMVSIGQQAYIGIGAYGLVVCGDLIGLDPFISVALAVVIARTWADSVAYSTGMCTRMHPPAPASPYARR